MTSKVFAKLNLKEQAEIVILNAPSSFETELEKLQNVKVYRKLLDHYPVLFALSFVTQTSEVDATAKSLARLAKGDAIIWFAYPKGTSKRYTCEFNRDTGWATLGELGFEGVRQVAIDEDWSALRFRRIEFIKSCNHTTRLRSWSLKLAKYQS